MMNISIMLTNVRVDGKTLEHFLSTFECVGMEGPWMKELACVTVQMVSLEIPVIVSVTILIRNVPSLVEVIPM